MFQKALGGYLSKGQRVAQIKIRHSEGNRIDGFLLVTSEDARERSLLDFQATLTPQGGLSSLEVGGGKVDLSTDRSK